MGYLKGEHDEMSKELDQELKGSPFKTWFFLLVFVLLIHAVPFMLLVALVSLIT